MNGLTEWNLTKSCEFFFDFDFDFFFLGGGGYSFFFFAPLIHPFQVDPPFFFSFFFCL